MIETIAKTYEFRQLFLKEVTKVVLNKIKGSYYRFVRADRVKDYMSSKMDLIISEKIIERYS